MSRRQRYFATIQQFTEPADYYSEAGAWTDLSEPVFVQVAPLSGRELLLARQVNAQTTHRIRMQFRGDITTKMRLRLLKAGVDSPSATNEAHWRTFHIESAVNVNEANREMDLMAVEQFDSATTYEAG